MTGAKIKHAALPEDGKGATIAQTILSNRIRPRTLRTERRFSASENRHIFAWKSGLDGLPRKLNILAFFSGLLAIRRKI